MEFAGNVAFRIAKFLPTTAMLPLSKYPEPTLPGITPGLLIGLSGTKLPS